MRLLLGSAVAWLILGGVVLGRYADEAVPTAYVARPLVFVALLSLLIGAASATTGKWAAAVAAAIAGGIAAFEIGYLAGSVLLVSGAIGRVVMRRGGRWPDAHFWQRAVVTFAAVFFVVAAGRAAAHVDPPAQAGATGTADGRSVYLVLLDGYPRGDTLRDDLGIDNEAFLAQLRERGFDVYDHARSPREYTELSLMSLLNGSDAAVPRGSGGVDDKRSARRQLDEALLPRLAMNAGYEYVVIDAPIGHVTYNAGTHIRHAGINNFEERLLAESSLAALMPAAPQLLTSSLRAHLDDSLASLVELTAPDHPRLVLAHLMAPHLPALYAADGSGLPTPSYWPERQLFGSVVEDVGITLDAYREVFPGHLRVVNQKVLDTIDAMLARDPDAVIVLFSDHGARYSFGARDEWSRSFLAAHTPDRPQLFGESPTNTHILCDVFVAYLDLPCQ